MPRKNHIAKGSANRIGRTPWGRNAVWPSSGTMSHRASHENAPEKSAMAEKTRMIPIEITDTMIAKRNEIAAPAEFRAMKTM